MPVEELPDPFAPEPPAPDLYELSATGHAEAPPVAADRFIRSAR